MHKSEEFNLQRRLTREKYQRILPGVDLSVRKIPDPTIDNRPDHILVTNANILFIEGNEKIVLSLVFKL